MKPRITKALLTIYLALFIASTLIAQEKSTRKAMLFSAILPGTGQIYLGNNTRGGIFIGAELMLVLSYMRLNNEIEWKQNSYMLYAHRYANVPLNSDEDFYKLISHYMNSDEYNLQIEQYYRNLYLIFRYNPDLYHENVERYTIKEGDGWNWENYENFLRFRELRREKQQLEILANFAIGGSVLNRIISVIDTALIARSIRRSGESDISEHTSFLSDIRVEPDYLKNGIMVKYEYRF